MNTAAQGRYTVAGYPLATNDNVELCYYEPYKAQPAKCIAVTSGTTGITHEFNSFRFDNGSELIIKHQVSGTSGNVHPNTTESVTWEFSY